MRLRNDITDINPIQDDSHYMIKDLIFTSAGEWCNDPALNKTEASDNVSSLIRYATRSKFECKPVLTFLYLDIMSKLLSKSHKPIMYDISLIKSVLWC